MNYNMLGVLEQIRQYVLHNFKTSRIHLEKTKTSIWSSLKSLKTFKRFLGLNSQSCLRLNLQSITEPSGTHPTSINASCWRIKWLQPRKCSWCVYFVESTSKPGIHISISPSLCSWFWVEIFGTIRNEHAHLQFAYSVFTIHLRIASMQTVKR